MLIWIFAPLTAMLSLFIQACMEPKMILRRYYVLLNYLWIKKKSRWLLKPLGLCIYCFSSWVWIGFFCIIWVEVLKKPVNLLLFIVLFLGLGVNYSVIKTFEKI